MIAHAHADATCAESAAEAVRDLLAQLSQARSADSANTAITSVTSDSRVITRASPEEARQTLFLAYPGAKADGRDYIDAVLRQGAHVLAEADGLGRSDVLAARDLKQLAGHLAAQIYAQPARALWMVGVTGTNGKTSCTQWLAQAFALLGQPCGVIGTLGAGMPGALRPNPNTTPDATLFHAALAQMVKAGARVCAAEVTSIGLMEGRVNGARFNVALMTNLTRDHLDYHGSFAAYADAKARLFTWPSLHHAVLNWDDETARSFAARLAQDVCLTSFSMRSSDQDCTLQADGIRFESGATCFDLVAGGQRYALRCPVIGAFNVSNLLGVAGVLHASDIAWDDIARVLPQLTPPPGRMEIVATGHTEPLVVVDYAHTPDALEQALLALAPIAQTQGGALTVVFGCGGDRDAGKRPLMGSIAARHAQHVVLTNDNPRGEDPQAILAAIAAGMQDPHSPLTPRTPGTPRITPDRATAIAETIASAHAQDVILIAGKGHEATQTEAGVSRPFSDAVHARAALRARSVA